MPNRPSILLCGAKPWPGSFQTDHRKHCQRADWTTTDIESGDGVDIVGDLQSLHKTTDLRFDGIFCPAVLEHIERPWVAMYAMGQLLKPGGVLHIQTHQTFPLHGYPHDYYRFSVPALNSLCFDAGLHVLASGYDGPCTITPNGECAVWNPLATSFLNVTICGIKPCAL
jgi:SAM-dependent methyltransferase